MTQQRVKSLSVFDNLAISSADISNPRFTKIHFIYAESTMHRMREWKRPQDRTYTSAGMHFVCAKEAKAIVRRMDSKDGLSAYIDVSATQTASETQCR